MSLIKITIYSTSNGRYPFSEWLEDLDTVDQAIVTQRLARVRLGNFGDVKSIVNSGGIFELRISYGPGYRIYFARSGVELIILLIAGDKKTQVRDIEKAKKYWKKYQEEVK